MLEQRAGAKSADFGKITEEALDVLRGRMGVKYVPPQRPWNTTVNVDSIYHFTQGIGDGNPLYRDPEYAARTSWGEIIAPPTYLLSGVGREQHGLPGVHGFWSSDNWTWHRVLRQGDIVKGTTELIGVDEKSSRLAGRMVAQITRITFVNQREELLATCDRTIMRIERAPGEKSDKHVGITKKHWTDDEIAKIADQYAATKRRGATPRHWQSVNEGDVVGPILKGPLTVTEEVAFFGGAGSLFIQASEVAWDYYRKHPRVAVRNLDTNVPDFPILVHWDDAWARKVGVPAAYDDGGQRIAWMGQVVTDWMGDDALMTKLRVELRKFVIVGDLLTIEGKIVRKYRGDKGEYLVDLEIAATNQRGEVVAPGSATVALPSAA